MEPEGAAEMDERRAVDEAGTVEVRAHEGEIYVLGETRDEAWPERVLMTGELVATARAGALSTMAVEEDGDRVTMEMANGRASYRRLRRTTPQEQRSVYLYELVETPEWEPVPEEVRA